MVTLSIQDNTKLLQQLKWGFKSTIKSINKTTKPIFRLPLFRLLFVLPIEDNAVRTGQTGYFLLTEVIKDYNVMIDGKNKHSQKIGIGQGSD